jgi:hypothetical protein
VIAQNAIRSRSMPANDATAGRIIELYGSHRTETVALAILFPFGAAGIAAFAGALGSRLPAPPARATAALAGILGTAGLLAVFAMTVALDLALAGYVHRGNADPDVVTALWITHNATFGVLMIALAVALAGLSLAAVDDGLIGPIWKPIGLAGALALGATGAATPALIDGSPFIAVGLLGFVAWLAFVTATSIALLRTPHPTPTPTPTPAPAPAPRGLSVGPC